MATNITIDKIRFKRGASINIPTLYSGEPYYAEDTEDFWIGSNGGNINLSKNEEYAELVKVYNQFLEPVTLDALKMQSLNLNDFKLGYVDSKVEVVNENVNGIAGRVDALEDNVNVLMDGIHSVKFYMPSPDSDKLVNTQRFNTLSNLALVMGKPIEIIFPAGLYEMTTMYVFNDTTVTLHKDTVINFTATKVPDPEAGYDKTISSVFMNARPYHVDDSNITGYDGFSNILIQGGTVKGGCFMTMIHGNNITVRNVRIQDATADHCFQVNSSRNVLIEGIVFNGVPLQDATRNYVEMIQLDYCTYAGVPGWVSTAPIYDHTMCDGVTIRNCTFGKSLDPTKLQNIYTAIGSHSEDGGRRNKNILIEGCTFADSTYANISARWMENVTIRNNSFSSTFIEGNLLHVDDSTNVNAYGNVFRDGRRAVYAHDTVGLHIHNNDIFGGYAYQMFITEGSENVTISDNHFNDFTYADYSGNAIIAIRGVKKFFVNNNTVKNVTLAPKNSSNVTQDTMFVYVYANSGENSQDGFVGRQIVDDYTKISLDAKVQYGRAINVTAISTRSSLTICTIGDSITAGGSTYGYWQETAIPMIDNVGKFYNRGYSGYSFTKYSSGAYTSILDKTDEIETADVYIVMLGTNDFSRNAPLGSLASASGAMDSMWGAMKKLYVDLGNKNKNAYIIFCTPLKRNASPTWETANSLGLKLIDYVNAIKDFCSQYSIPVIDLFNISGISNNTQSTLLYDGLHPNVMGNQRIGRIIARQVNSII